jgi:hypothetical protein
VATTRQRHLLGVKKLPAPGTALPRSVRMSASSRSGLRCAWAGVLISGDVIAGEAVAGLEGGLNTRASAGRNQIGPALTHTASLSSDLSGARPAADMHRLLVAGLALPVATKDGSVK